MRKIYRFFKEFRGFIKAFKNAKFDFSGMFDSLAVDD